MLRAALLAGAALGAAACFGIATRSLILGSAEGGWHYWYFEQPRLWPALGTALVAIAFVAALLFVTRRFDDRREWPQLLAWILAAFVVQGLLRPISPFGLGSIVASDAANGFYGVARRFEPAEILNPTRTMRAQMPLHAQSNLPGKPLLTRGLQAISNRPHVLAWMVVALSNAGALLIYVFVRDLFRDRRVALFAAILYLFVPARLFFLPLMNTVTPAVILCCAVLLQRWLTTGRATFAVLFGVSLYALVFFEPLPLVMGLLFASLIARSLWQGEILYGRLVAQGLLAVVAFAAVDGLLYLTTGFDLVNGFRRIAAHATEFNVASNRPYTVWIRENLREFVFGVGVCQGVLIWAALAHGLRGPERWPARLTRPITVVCAGLLSVLIAIDLLGVNRGEVTRLWIFLACFFQIPAAYVCAQFDDRTAMATVLAISILQSALGVSHIAFIIP